MTAPPSKALGTTHDVNELAPGHVDHTRGVAEDLGKEAERIGEMFDAFRAVRVENWAGESYAAWETAVEVETAKWKSYLSLLTTAQGAISSYADSLETAQSRGQTAIDTWDESEQKTEDAVNAYNEAIRDYNKDVEDGVAGASPPAAFSDPGEALRLEAQEILTEARSDLDAAGQAALVRLGMLEGGNVGSETVVLGSEGSSSGPSFSWEAWGDRSAATRSTGRPPRVGSMRVATTRLSRDGSSSSARSRGRSLRFARRRATRTTSSAATSWSAPTAATRWAVPRRTPRSVSTSTDSPSRSA